MLRYSRVITIAGAILLCAVAFFSVAATPASAATADQGQPSHVSQNPPRTPGRNPGARGNNSCPAIIGERGRGNEVKTLQDDLNKLGFRGRNRRALRVDGNFGPDTTFALKQFQLRHHIKADGMAGPSTWQLLVRCDPRQR